ncbi:MAG: HAMP domain-containing protein [Gammaproteobacteria bacterium]|nr:HAMP domain-containing protein [Gammaproteobacteria bacterium]
MLLMRITLFLKLFVMQLVAAATLVGGTIAVLGLFTGQNFAGYLHSRNAELAEEAAEEIGARYLQTGDLVAAAAGIRALRPPQGSHENRRDHRDGRMGQERRRPRGPLPPRAFLLDAEGRFLSAPPRDPGRLERTPIVASGQVVGYLAWPRRMAPQELDSLFTSRQGRAYLLIGAAAILLAALLALILARRTAQPVRALSAASAALARRDFSARVRVSGSDELARLAADFNRLAAALEGYDRRQRQWLADIAHELRNPLAILRAQLDAILDGVRAADARALDTLASEVARLEALVGQLHLLSLAEAGGLQLQLSTCAPAEFVTATVKRYRPRFAAAGFELRCEQAASSATPVRIDRQRMEAVLANLLENALRYADPPGPVTVSIGDEDGQLLLVVSDAGPGVPADMLPRLFDRLFRADPARSGGGTGLGLAIVRSIVEAHGGSVTAHASTAGGLEIRCRWPAEPAA